MAEGTIPESPTSFFNGDVDRAYNQFYAAMKNAGRYELVGSPAEADLLFEIRFLVQPSGTNVFKGDTLGPTYDPQFRLEIRDPKTNALLWGFTEHMEWAISAGQPEQEFRPGFRPHRDRCTSPGDACSSLLRQHAAKP